MLSLISQRIDFFKSTDAYHNLSLEFKWSHIGKSLQVLMLMLSAGVFGVAYGFIPVRKNAYHCIGLTNALSFLLTGLLAGGLLG